MVHWLAQLMSTNYAMFSLYFMTELCEEYELNCSQSKQKGINSLYRELKDAFHTNPQHALRKEPVTRFYEKNV